MKSNLVDIACQIVHSTDDAILIHDGTRKAWLPRKAVEIEQEDDCVIVTMPERLAHEKGLI